LRLCIINCGRVVAEVLARHDGFGCRALSDATETALC